MITTLSACAVFPTTRTYFKPMNANNDSELAKSQSCGYHKAKYDGLTKTLADTDISIFPHWEEGVLLSATVYLQTADFGHELTPDNVNMSVNDGADVLLPMAVSLQHRRATDEGDKESIWYQVEFNIPVDEIDTMRFNYVDKQGAAEFEFKKVKQSDIYYASINC